MDIKKIENSFTDTYLNFKWRHGNNESKSGLGSTIDFTNGYRKNLLNILGEYKIKNILDCSCGDWNWMKTISNNFYDYTGLDIVKDIVEVNNLSFGNDRIRFIHDDMFNYLSNTKEHYDLIISRHTFEHLPTEYVLKTMSEIKNKSNYFLFSGQNNLVENIDINFDGCSSRNINLSLEPYHSILGDPIYVFFDSPINNDGEPVYNHVLGNLFKSK